MEKFDAQLNRAEFLAETAFFALKGEFWGDASRDYLVDERTKLHGARLMCEPHTDARALLDWAYEVMLCQVQRSYRVQS